MSVSLAALTVMTIACPALAQVAPPPAPAPPLEPLPRADFAPLTKPTAEGAEVGAVVEPRPTVPGYSLGAFIALGVASHAASVFDATITRHEVLYDGGYEENPLVRPYVRSYALFAVTQIGPFIYDGLGWLMTRSSHRWIRRLWWLPQTFNAVTCGAAGFYDLR